MSEPLSLAVDRAMIVPPGHVVRTGYAPIDNVRMLCRDRMSAGDVERAFRKRLQLGGQSAWPPPYGRWAGEAFEIVDGRHEFIAALMLGCTHLFVAWLEPQSAD